MWQRPHPIDVTATVARKTPRQWQASLPGQETVAVLPLVDDERGLRPGWCTMGGEILGPELEAVCGGVNSKQPTHVGVWRQGNLLHFGFDVPPDRLNANGRKLLLNGIDYIARFLTDRPIARVRTFVDPAGGEVSRARLDYLLAQDGEDPARLAALFVEPWRAELAALEGAAARRRVRERLPATMRDDRRFTWNELALALGVDLRTVAGVRAVVGELGTGRGDEAAALLARLVPDGPRSRDAADWRRWLGAHAHELGADPHSLVLRPDPVRRARGLESSQPSPTGAARADAEPGRDAGALALAGKVIAWHGGRRALDELTSFSFRRGDLRLFWDRRRGLVRIEDHRTAGSLPAVGRPTVIDLAAGAAPAGMGTVWTWSVQDLFLPLLLLDPGTSLERRSDDGEGRPGLSVRLAGFGLTAPDRILVRIGPEGQLADVIADGWPRSTRVQLARVTATTAVGPLRLPTAFAAVGDESRTWRYEDLRWNPPVPDDLESAEGNILR